MKISTRFFGVLGLLLAQLSALAATVTVQVGDNFYQPQTVNIRPGDQVVWRYVGQSSHPTASDNGAWTTFPMDAANTTKTIAFPTIGNFFYHCQAHGAAGNGTSLGIGQAGAIFVNNSPQATFDAKTAGVSLNLYPNPSKGLVMVTVPKAGPDFKLRLSNIIGREVRTIALRPEAAAEGMALNLSDLPAGMYFYSLLQNDKVLTTKRLVLQN